MKISRSLQFQTPDEHFRSPTLTPAALIDTALTFFGFIEFFQVL